MRPIGRNSGLNYHRIGDAGTTRLDRDLWSACEETFDQQLAYIKQNCDVITPNDIDEVRRNPRGVHVLVTFDDGYRDNYELAYPALRRHGAFRRHSSYRPASSTIHACRGGTRSPRSSARPRSTWCTSIRARRVAALGPWPATESTRRRCCAALRFQAPAGSARVAMLDRLRAMATSIPAALPDSLWMTWDMLREMTAHGMTIGGHTVIIVCRGSRRMNSGARSPAARAGGSSRSSARRCGTSPIQSASARRSTPTRSIV